MPEIPEIENDKVAKKRWESMVVLRWLMFIPMMRMEYERPLTPPQCYREPTKPCYGNYDPEAKLHVDYSQGQHYRYGGYGCRGYGRTYYRQHCYTKYTWKWCYDRKVLYILALNQTLTQALVQYSS